MGKEGQYWWRRQLLDPHDADNAYAWSTGAPYKENGTAFTSFLAMVNGGGGFAGANGWRLPTLAELQTILSDFACKGEGGTVTCGCLLPPCVDSALDAANTRSDAYWSATGYGPDPFGAWFVFFYSADVSPLTKTAGLYVRAVRGGW